MRQQNARPLYIPYAGPTLLDIPLLNKGSAFSEDERIAFNLIGLLPANVETIDEQLERAYSQYQACNSDLEKHIYLRGIQDDNETLFFRLLADNLDEMLPIVYTPTVGQACQKFSRIYRNHRGLFVSYPDRDRIDDLLHSATKGNVKVIVVTDGERILGLGDQGIGGMGIPIGKLALYSACGGISPAYTLPVVLDVGTDNADLLDDPMYMGWRHARIGDDDYAEFVERFIAAVLRRWPNVLLQFEDFAQRHANPLLTRYRDRLCCFNDDIQGTAAVCVGTIIAACKAKNERISEQSVAFVGAGSAGCGVAEQIVVAMVDDGLSESQARQRIIMIDKQGILTDTMGDLPETQKRLAQPRSRIDAWAGDVDAQPLLAVVENAPPTVLIGVCGQRGIFSRQVIQRLHQKHAKPLVMPLSNPTSQVEATPEDILDWTEGQALVATGSPFAPVDVDGEKRAIAQCNNVYIFPGVGLGVVAARASRVTDEMFMEASRALAGHSPLANGATGALLPALGDTREVSQAIAFAVAKRAQADGVALETSDAQIRESVERHFWYPDYRHYRRVAF